MRRLILSLAGALVALAGGLGVAMAIAAVTSTTVTGNNLVCKAGAATVPCSSSTSLSNGQSLTVGANPDPPSSGGVLFGIQTVAPTADNNPSGLAQAFQYAAAASGTTSDAQVYVDAGSASTKLIVGVYSDSGGKPASLLATGSLASPHAAAWNDVPLSAGAIVSGARYWVALLGTGGQLNYRDTFTGGTNSYVNAATGLTAMPATYQPGNVWIASPASAYINGTAAATTTTTTSSSTSTTTTTTTTAPPPPTTGFPDATNTGYQAAPDYPGSLTAASSSSATCPTTISSNHTYSFCDYPGGVDVGASGAPVSNVTFHGCRFHGVGSSAGLVLLYGDNITIDYSTISPDAASPPVSYSQGYQYGVEGDGSYRTSVQQLTMTHDNVWGFGNAVDIAGSTQAKPQVFRENYIHDARQDGGIDHTDGIGDLSGSGSGSYDVIDHNTIMSAGNTNGIAFQQGSYSNFQITNNLFGGFGNTIALWAPAPNTTFTGNTFSTLLKPDWTPLYPQSFWTSPGSVWKNNRWSVPAGAAWGNPTHDGWYWIPNSADISGTDDTPYVSQTGP